MIELMCVKDNEKYFKKLNTRIAMSSMWRSLQTKSEVGLGKSERGYQEVARIMVGNIARGLELNDDLAECLTMCRGSFFPAYGKEGKKVIKQFMKDAGIEMSEANLARNYIEYQLYRSGYVISPEFDQYSLNYLMRIRTLKHRKYSLQDYVEKLLIQ